MRRAVIIIMVATLSVGPIGSVLATISGNGGTTAVEMRLQAAR